MLNILILTSILIAFGLFLAVAVTLGRLLNTAKSGEVLLYLSILILASFAVALGTTTFPNVLPW